AVCPSSTVAEARISARTRKDVFAVMVRPLEVGFYPSGNISTLLPLMDDVRQPAMGLACSMPQGLPRPKHIVPLEQVLRRRDVYLILLLRGTQRRSLWSVRFLSKSESDIEDQPRCGANGHIAGFAPSGAEQQPDANNSGRDRNNHAAGRLKRRRRRIGPTAQHRQRRTGDSVDDYAGYEAQRQQVDECTRKRKHQR